jgi:hypothetical protein
MRICIHVCACVCTAFARGDGLIVVLNALKSPPAKKSIITLSGLPIPPQPKLMIDILFPTVAVRSSHPFASNDTISLCWAHSTLQGRIIFACACSDVAITTGQWSHLSGVQWHDRDHHTHPKH